MNNLSSPKLFQCDHCDQRFSTQQDKIDHAWHVHAMYSVGPFDLSWNPPEKVFYFIKDAKDGSVEILGPAYCPDCGWSYSYDEDGNSDIDEHQRIVHGNQPQPSFRDKHADDLVDTLIGIGFALFILIAWIVADHFI